MHILITHKQILLSEYANSQQKTPPCQVVQVVFHASEVYQVREWSPHEKKKRDVFIQEHRLKVGLTCVLLSFCLVAKTLSWVSCAQHSVGSASQSLWSLAQGWKIRFKPWHLTPDFTSVVAKIAPFCADSLMGFYFFFKISFSSWKYNSWCCLHSRQWQINTLTESSLVNAFIWEEDLMGFCLGWHGNENREFCMCVWPALSSKTPV